MGWIAVMSYVLTVSDTVVLSMYRPSSEVGIYTAALRMATLTGFILVAVNTILAPNRGALSCGRNGPPGTACRKSDAHDPFW